MSKRLEPDNNLTRQYVNLEQLSQLTPWSPRAIQTMQARGKLKEGVHFFKPFGPHSRAIFSWPKVVELIEHSTAKSESVEGQVILANGEVIDLDEATRIASRLCR